MQMTHKRGRKETQVFPSTENSAHWSFPKTLLTLKSRKVETVLLVGTGHHRMLFWEVHNTSERDLLQ